MNKANINSMIIINKAQELVISFDPASGLSVESKNNIGQIIISSPHRAGNTSWSSLKEGEALSMRTIGISVLRRSPY